MGGRPPGALAGRTAVVTGATSGIGLAIGAELAGLGAQVTLVGRDRGQARGGRGPGPGRPPRRRRHHRAGRPRPARRRPRPRRGARQPAAEARRAGPQRRRARARPPADRRRPRAHAPGARGRPVPAHRPAAGTAAARRGAARVLTMSSGGHVHPAPRRGAPPVDRRRLRRHRRLRPRQSARRSSSTRAWAQRFPEAGIGFHALHPGWVDTPGLHSGLPGFTRLGPLLRPIPEGADTAVWLAWTPEATAPGGDFWLDRAAAAPSTCPGPARRPARPIGCGSASSAGPASTRRRAHEGRHRRHRRLRARRGPPAAPRPTTSPCSRPTTASAATPTPSTSRSTATWSPRRHRLHRLQRAELPELPGAPRRARGGDPAQRDELRGVATRGSGLEYRGTNLDTLYAQRSNLPRPSFHRMLVDILRFNRGRCGSLGSADGDDDLDATLRRPRGAGPLLPGLRRPLPGAVRRRRSGRPTPPRSLDFPAAPTRASWTTTACSTPGAARCGAPSPAGRSATSRP